MEIKSDEITEVIRQQIRPWAGQLRVDEVGEVIDRLLDPACIIASDKKGASRCPAATRKKKATGNRKT
jgi:hypothetical protein